MGKKRKGFDPSSRREISSFTTVVYDALAKFFEGSLPGMRPGLAGAYLDDISKAIERRTAVLWVGTGASMSAGAPSWMELIRRLTERVPTENVTSADHEWVQERLRERNLIQLADYLEVALGKSLHGEVKEIFSDLQPQSIHREIQRTPFDLILTTNFDHLIEDIYINKPRVFTGDQPFTLLQAIKDAYRMRLANMETRGLPILLKLHGSIGESESLVLSSSGYRDIQHKSHRLRDVLKHLLMMRQFLFLGTSLTDPHLLGLLDEVIAEYGIDRFGPHYAILGASEANAARVNLLDRLYSIRTLVFQDEVPATLRQSGGDSDSPLSVAKMIGLSNEKRYKPMERGHLKSTGVKYVLNQVGGRVSLLLAERRKNSYTMDVEFSQAKAFIEVLREAVLVSGSLRGDICLIDHDSDQLSQRLVYRHHAGPTDAEVAYFSQFSGSGFSKGDEHARVDVDSVCGRAFYICNPGEVVYAPNVDALRSLPFPEEDGGEEGEILRDEVLEARFGKMHYRCAHSDVKSEIAVPVFSQGVRIGVLNLESRQLNAYSDKHQRVLHHYAKTLEAIHIVASSLHEKGKALRRYEHAGDELKNLVRNFGLLTEIQFLIYTADYINGELTGLICTLPEIRARAIHFRIDYKDASLAIDAFRGQGKRFYPDAVRAGLDGEIDERNRRALTATGPIFAMPILSGEVTAGVFVGWVPSDSLTKIRMELDDANFQPLSLSYQNVLFRFLRAVSTGNKSRLRAMAVKLAQCPSSRSRRRIDSFEVFQWSNAYLSDIRKILKIKGTELCPMHLLMNLCDWDRVLHVVAQLMESTLKAVHEVSLFRRVRLYLRNEIDTSARMRPKDSTDRLSVGLFLSMEVAPNGNRNGIKVHRIGAHEKESELKDLRVKRDPYLRFVLERSMHDPLTKAQQPNVLGADERRTILGKEPGRYWLVTPIVRMEHSFDDGRGASGQHLDGDIVAAHESSDETSAIGNAKYHDSGQSEDQALGEHENKNFLGYLVLDDHQCPERDWSQRKDLPDDQRLDRLGQESLNEIQTVFIPTVLDYAAGLIGIAVEQKIDSERRGKVDLRGQMRAYRASHPSTNIVIKRKPEFRNRISEGNSKKK